MPIQNENVSYNLRSFYILAVTQMLSVLGSAMTGFAISIWIFTETGNTTPLFLVGFFRVLPHMLFKSLAGVFADRLNRKKLIIYGDAGQAIPTLLLMLSFLSGNFQLWHLYLATIVQAFFSMMQGPALMASVTMLVPDSHRNRANAITEIIDPMANMISPIIAGFLYAFVNVAGIIFIDLATFIIAVAVIIKIPIPQPRKSKESVAVRGSVFSEMRGALQFLLDHRALLYLALYFLFLNFITNGVWRLVAPYVLIQTDYNEPFLGILQGMGMLGLTCGGLVAMFWMGTKNRTHTIFPALIFSAIGLIAFGLVRQPIILCIVYFLLMFPNKFVNALVLSIQQAKIPPDMQGRVFGLMGQFAIFAMPITYLITGPIIDGWLEPAVGQAGWEIVAPLVGNEQGSGIALYIIVCGVLSLAATILVYNLPAIRHMERDLPNYDAIAEPESEEELDIKIQPA